MRIISYLFMLIILLCIILFAIYNSNFVKVDYLMGTKSVPLVLLIALSLVLGAFIGFFTGMLKYIKAKKENFGLRHEIKLAKKEISNLRQMPLRESY